MNDETQKYCKSNIEYCRCNQKLAHQAYSMVFPENGKFRALQQRRIICTPAAIRQVGARLWLVRVQRARRRLIRLVATCDARSDRWLVAFLPITLHPSFVREFSENIAALQPASSPRVPWPRRLGRGLRVSAGGTPRPCCKLQAIATRPLDGMHDDKNSKSN